MSRIATNRMYVNVALKVSLKNFLMFSTPTCYLFNQNIQSFDFSDIISDFESLDEIKKAKYPFSTFEYL